MFFAGITYNIIAISMVICLFIGSFAFGGDIKLLYGFFFDRGEISVEMAENCEKNFSNEEKGVACEEKNQKNEEHLQPNYSPPLQNTPLYSCNLHNYLFLTSVSLRAPPYSL